MNVDVYLMWMFTYYFGVSGSEDLMDQSKTFESYF